MSTAILAGQWKQHEGNADAQDRRCFNFKSLNANHDGGPSGIGERTDFIRVHVHYTR